MERKGGKNLYLTKKNNLTDAANPYRRFFDEVMKADREKVNKIFSEIIGKFVRMLANPDNKNISFSYGYLYLVETYTVTPQTRCAFHRVLFESLSQRAELGMIPRIIAYYANQQGEFFQYYE